MYRFIEVPKFEDHPDAKCFVQNADGWWCKNVKTDKVVINIRGGWVISDDNRSGWVTLNNKTLVLGDSWKQSLMIRPHAETSEKEEQVFLSNFTQQEYDQLHEELALKDELISDLLEQIKVLSEVTDKKKINHILSKTTCY